MLAAGMPYGLEDSTSCDAATGASQSAAKTNLVLLAFQLAAVVSRSHIFARTGMRRELA
jgi:hypothetical protein